MLNRYICLMKKAMLYFLVTCFLSGAAIAEVFKLPLLVSHYIEHSNRNPKIGIIDFLSIHYWGIDINDNDQDQDMKLPFKKSFQSSQQVLFCSSEIYHLPKTNHSFSNCLVFFYQPRMIDTFITKLYRPPQLFLSV